MSPEAKALALTKRMLESTSFDWRGEARTIVAEAERVTTLDKAREIYRRHFGAFPMHDQVEAMAAIIEGLETGRG